jgi:subtilisin family serine protease
VPAPTRVDRASNDAVMEETLQGYTSYYARYGIADFHARGVMGAGVSIVIIDCGLLSAKSELLSNVNVISLRRSKGSSGGKSGGPHGIAVASLVAARSTKSALTGIAPDATVTLIDVDDVDGEIRLSVVLEALSRALELKPDIVNISLGTDIADDDLHAAIKTLTDAGILVFAAAGNSGNRIYEFPAACPGVICVGSMNAQEVPSTFNSRNDTVTVFAPGERSTQKQVPDSFALTALDGTSFSSPFAAALLALHMSELRSQSPMQPAVVSREEAITFLRTSFHNDCTHHIYVQERFADFGCREFTAKGAPQLISAPSCAPQFRMAMFWFGVSICLGGALAVAILGRTDACAKLCKVVFPKTGKRK